MPTSPFILSSAKLLSCSRGFVGFGSPGKSSTRPSFARGGLYLSTNRAAQGRRSAAIQTSNSSAASYVAETQDHLVVVATPNTSIIRFAKQALLAGRRRRDKPFTDASRKHRTGAIAKQQQASSAVYQDRATRRFRRRCSSDLRGWRSTHRAVRIALQIVPPGTKANAWREGRPARIRVWFDIGRICSI